MLSIAGCGAEGLYYVVLHTAVLYNIPYFDKRPELAPSHNRVQEIMLRLVAFAAVS